MIILGLHPLQRTSFCQWHITMIFGVGLIGYNILLALIQQHVFFARKFRFTWENKRNQIIDEERIVQQVIALALRMEENGHSLNVGRINIVWSAGKAGFGMGKKEAEEEMYSFQRILNLSKRFRNQLPTATHSFHMISSAGGLFEGQSNIDSDNIPNPKRIYGLIKLEQESLLAEIDVDIINVIYRPSSVYGFAGLDKRMGLVPTLVWNALKNKVTNIFGQLETIRDYVYAADIGDFVANQILFHRTISHHTYTLASGKPTCILEVIRIVEQILSRRIYLRCQLGEDNIKNNSYNTRSLPEDWSPTELETGIRQTCHALLTDNIIHSSEILTGV